MHAAGRNAPGIYNVSDIAHYSALLRVRIDEFEVNHRGIYLGFKTLRHLKNGPGSPLKVRYAPHSLPCCVTTQSPLPAVPEPCVASPTTKHNEVKPAVVQSII
jgi:hypothetical protein